MGEDLLNRMTGNWSFHAQFFFVQRSFAREFLQIGLQIVSDVNKDPHFCSRPQERMSAWSCA